MKLIIFLVVVLSSTWLKASASEGLDESNSLISMTGSIEHVVRGDRVVFINNEGRRFVVNLTFIKSPEGASGPWVHDVPYGDAAKTVIENRCMKREDVSITISLSSQESRPFHSGMLVCQDVDVAKLLVMSGLVYLQEGIEIPDGYLEALEDAKRNGFGLHGLGETVQ